MIARQALIPVAALLTSVAILLAGNGLQGVLLPLRASLDAFSTVAIGLIGTSYFAGFGAGCLFGPRLVRRAGHIRTFTAMTSIAAAAALGHAFFHAPAVWWLLRIASGFCFAVLFMVIESWLNESSTKETRGVVLSAYMILNLTVVAGGQLLLPLHDLAAAAPFATASVLISLAAVPVALSRATAPAPISETRVRVRRLFKLSPSGAITCLAVGMANGGVFSLAPLFAKEAGFDEAGIALFMSAMIVGGAAGQWPLGKLSDRGDRRHVIVLGAAIAGSSAILLSLPLFESRSALFLFATIWGAAAFPLYSLSVALTNDHADPGDFVETSSGLLLLFAAGSMAGPLLASILTESLGISLLYSFAAAVYSILIVFVVFRIKGHDAVKQEDHVPFEDSLYAAQTVSPVFDEVIQEQIEQDQASSSS